MKILASFWKNEFGALILSVLCKKCFGCQNERIFVFLSSSIGKMEANKIADPSY